MVKSSDSGSPFVDESPEIPQVVSHGGHRCYGKGSGGGECEYMELEFETGDGWDAHRRKFHPISCSNWCCDNIASYSRLNGPHSYCVEHVPDPEDVGGGYRWRRTNTEAVVESPTLPDDHLIEIALSGLE